MKWFTVAKFVFEAMFTTTQLTRTENEEFSPYENFAQKSKLIYIEK